MTETYAPRQTTVNSLAIEVAILSIEGDEAKHFNFEDILKDFAEKSKKYFVISMV